MERIALNSSDDYKALSADPVNRFEMEKPNYRKAEALMDAISACLCFYFTAFTDAVQDNHGGINPDKTYTKGVVWV